MRTKLALISGVALFCLTSVEALAETRLALVIEQGDYLGNLPDITKAEEEADAVQTSLEAIDFQVTRVTDLRRGGLQNALDDFRRALDRSGKNTIGFVYYTGHGAQHPGTEESYLLGTETDLEVASDLVRYGINLSDLHDEFAATGARAIFLVFDACRTNPGVQGYKAGTKGLTRIQAKNNVLIAYSTSPGDVAQEGVYAPVLAKELLEEDDHPGAVFARVQTLVARATNLKQQPWMDNRIFEELCLGCGIPQANTNLPNSMATTNNTFEIEPLSEFTNSQGEPCRVFITEYIKGGETFKSEDTFCRSSDGLWYPSPN